MYVNDSASDISANTSDSASSRENEIEIVRIDEDIEETPTFIKMDIEGAEQSAIIGCEKTIRKHHPKLAICIYHGYEDSWKIPSMIYDMNPDYKFYIRHNGEIWFQQNLCFCVNHKKNRSSEMRKYIKKQILDIIGTMYEVHISISNFIEQSEFDNAISLLGDCQNTAVQIGDIIDNSEGEGSPVIHLLEEYCETIYQVSLIVKDDNVSGKARTMLDESLSSAESGIKNDIPVRTEIVFMPYNASMWDSLESVWKAANDDPDCDAYVVPIPYYERNPDQSLGQYHYEGDRFPEYVPITHYSKYDLEKRRPDTIYIHNPYDGNNFITTVDPRYYSTELKKYTDELIYIPYFVLEDREQWDDKYLLFVEKYVLVPAVMNADKVIVQSENMRKIYIRTLLKYCGSSPEHLKLYTEKIFGTGSPKFDKISNQKYKIPEEWLKIINKPDGGKKKIVFYNTTVTPMIDFGEKVMVKIKDVLNIFYENRDDIALLWRPHPLLKETVKSMHPELYNEYMQLVDDYIKAGWGIYDDTTDLDRAIEICDAYYGDGSSVVQLIQRLKKPIMIQNVNIVG